MGKVASVVARELREILPAMICFLITSHLVLSFASLMLAHYHIDAGSALGATIAALIVAKAIMVAEVLPFIDHFRTRPLAWGVAWKTLIYSVITFVFRYLEELIPLIGDAGSVAAANEKLLEEIVWPHFSAIQILLLATILAWVTAVELGRVLGPGRLSELYFGRRTHAA